MDALLLPVLAFGFVFFFITTLISIHNRICFRDLGSGISPESVKWNNLPLISVLIPARNEENNLHRLLESLDKQDYPGIEIHLLDDQSEDGTKQIAEAFALKSRFPMNIHAGADKPSGWLGKNWACHQLASAAQGEILLFLDADTWLAPSCITGIAGHINRYNLDFTTVWPHQVMISSLERSVISNVYATIALYLPTYYSYRSPKWIPFRSLRKKVKPMFANACGQCMVFTRKTYDEIGGHASVRDKVVEDIMLARLTVKSGKTMRMFHGTDQLWCRMYQSGKEVFSGFRKNFFAGFGYRLIPFLLAWLMHILVYLLPPLILVLTVVNLLPTNNPLLVIVLSGSLTVIAFLQRFWVARFLKWPPSTTLLYLPGILWFQILAFVVIRDHFLNAGTSWKGRPV